MSFYHDHTLWDYVARCWEKELTMTITAVVGLFTDQNLVIGLSNNQ
jgi:hypothetical protein